MKKYIMLALSLVFVFMLGGCNNSNCQDGEICLYLNQQITEVVVADSSKEDSFKLTEKQVEDLKEWAKSVEAKPCDKKDFDENDNIYNLTFNDGEFAEISYVITSDTEHYLLLSDNWYSVNTPTDLPF